MSLGHAALSLIILRGGIPARSASRPAGRRANPPKADIVGNSTSVEWGRSGVKSG